MLAEQLSGPITGVKCTCEWGKREGESRETWLLIGCFTGVDPITVNIDRLGQIWRDTVKGRDLTGGSLHNQTHMMFLVKRIQVIGVWNSSKQTLHDIIPVLRVRSLEKTASILVMLFICCACLSLFLFSFLVTYILTSQDFSWLQNGQVNWTSRLPVIFFFGGGFLFDFLRPISNVVVYL